MQLIPLCTIRVKRDEKSVTPEIGKPFDFTSDEKADLDNLSAQSGTEYYRLPVNETAVAVEESKAAEKPAKASKKADDAL